MNKKIFFLILLNILMLPVLAQAAEANNVTIQSMVHAAENTALFIASGVTVILWIVTGVLFLSAQGAPEKVNMAKKALIAAVAGTMLVIVAASAIALVGSMFGISAPGS